MSFWLWWGRGAKAEGRTVPSVHTVVDSSIRARVFTVLKRRPFEAQGAQDRRTPNYLMSTEALVFSHSIRRVQVLPF